MLHKLISQLLLSCLQPTLDASSFLVQSDFRRVPTTQTKKTPSDTRHFVSQPQTSKKAFGTVEHSNALIGQTHCCRRRSTTHNEKVHTDVRSQQSIIERRTMETCSGRLWPSRSHWTSRNHWQKSGTEMATESDIRARPRSANHSNQWFADDILINGRLKITTHNATRCWTTHHDLPINNHCDGPQNEDYGSVAKTTSCTESKGWTSKAHQQKGNSITHHFQKRIPSRVQLPHWDCVGNIHDATDMKLTSPKYPPRDKTDSSIATPRLHDHSCSVQVRGRWRQIWRKTLDNTIVISIITTDGEKSRKCLGTTHASTANAGPRQWIGRGHDRGQPQFFNEKARSVGAECNSFVHELEEELEPSIDYIKRGQLSQGRRRVVSKWNRVALEKTLDNIHLQLEPSDVKPTKTGPTTATKATTTLGYTVHTSTAHEHDEGGALPGTGPLLKVQNHQTKLRPHFFRRLCVSDYYIFCLWGIAILHLSAARALHKP